MNTPLATLDTTGSKPVLRFTRTLHHSPEKVWHAITEPAEIARWFPASMTMELRAGAPIAFRFEEQPDVDDSVGQVLEVDAPKLFAFRWDADVLRFEIVPEGDGCQLLFTHTLDGSATWGDEISAARHAAGWDTCLSLLAARLDGRNEDWSRHEWFTIAERYVEAFGLAEGTCVQTPDGPVVRFERDMVQPVEEVWALLVDDNPEPVVGAKPPLRATNAYVRSEEITALDAPAMLEYAALHDGAPAGMVRWEGEDQKFGSRLVVTHALPAEGPDLRALVLAVWHTHLELFFAAANDKPRPWPDERVAQLRDSYADSLS